MLNYILIALILKKLRENYLDCSKQNQCIAFGILFFFLFDFSFMMASRVAETTLYRLLFVQSVIVVFLSKKMKTISKFVVMGILTTVSVFAVYITNVFLYLAIVIVIIMLGVWKGKKEFFKASGGFFLGSLSAFLVCEIYYIGIWGGGALRNAYEAITAFSSQEGYEIISGFWVMLRSTVRFIASNANLYSTAVLFICLLGIPLFLSQIVRKKDIVSLFFLSIVFSFYLQTLVSEDYVVRKFLVIYPILFYLLYVICLTRKAYEPIYAKMIEKKKNKIFLSVYAIVCFLACICIPIFRFYIISNETQNDFSNLDKKIILVLSGIALGILLSLVLYNLLGNGRRWKIYVGGISTAVVLTIVLNIYFDYQYIIYKPTYSERQCMLDLGKKVEEGYVIGAVFPVGYALYNECKPIISSNIDTGESLSKHKEIWYLDYSFEESKDGTGYLETLFPEYNYKIVKVKDFHREFQTFGIKRNMALYRAETKGKSDEKN
ncbi:MAG: hypothetical protein RR737_01100 [Lachnospiraceae bacterium]